MSASLHNRRERIPIWMAVIIVLAMLPVLAFPSLLGMAPSDDTVGVFVWLYPLYVIVSGICAWICWPERKDVCWILIILMLLSHAAMWLLVTGS